MATVVASYLASVPPPVKAERCRRSSYEFAVSHSSCHISRVSPSPASTWSRAKTSPLLCFLMNGGHAPSSSAPPERHLAEEPMPGSSSSSDPTPSQELAVRSGDRLPFPSLRRAPIPCCRRRALLPLLPLASVREESKRTTACVDRARVAHNAKSQPDPPACCSTDWASTHWVRPHPSAFFCFPPVGPSLRCGPIHVFFRGMNLEIIPETAVFQKNP